MAKSFLKRIFGDSNQRTIARLQKTVQKINTLEPTFQAFSGEELRLKTQEFKDRLTNGETLDDVLPEAFAAIREASRRTIGLRPYDVQLIGGMILHEGQVAEMRTGEGKTLVATLPLYLNALKGLGAHLVTPNDYLAKYGAQWMGPVYHALGIRVSVIQSGAGRPDEASFLYDPDYTSADDRYQNLRPITRREAYRADITYGTNNEFGFDYLRDNMVIDLNQCTQRELHYAIVDEVDSILIDEARTPLIISGPAEESSELYQRFAGIVPRLQPETDYEVDERNQTVILTEEGTAKVEQIVHIPEGESLYDPQHAHMLPYLDNALRAKEFFDRDKKYVVRDGEIIIVDEFTGRLMFGRRYSEGLHQAIEAKEHVEIRRESLTYATITFQNFFRMYDKLAGMTGTAATEAEELRKIYGLDVVILPTNVEYHAQFGNLKEHEVPPQDSKVAFAGVLPEQHNYKVTVYDGPNGERYYRRLDMPDQIYKSEMTKFKAVISEIEAVYKAGRPVLVGTTAIETSERVSKMLKARQIPHNVLNAKYHEQEAVIIAQAGQPGAVTIATNMAGRGVDILLGGNPEGMARDDLRREEVDLTQIPSLAWEEALKMARQGEDPTRTYPERWAKVLFDRVQKCERDRKRIYELGGLHVIGTERHEARRIDNQLRGRAGRQGDPGSSRFYISLEDELLRRFGGERLQPWMERAGLDEAPLEFNAIAKVIESVQQRVEGFNFDIRKHVLEYDDVVNKQREVVYAERAKLLSRADLHDDLMDMVKSAIQRIVEPKTQGYEDEWDLEGLLAELRQAVPALHDYTVEKLQGMTPEAMIEEFVQKADQHYQDINQRLGEMTYHSLRQEETSLQALAETRDPFTALVIERINTDIGYETVAPWYDQPIRRMPTEVEEQIKNVIINVGRLFRDRRLMLQQLDNHWVRHLTDLEMLREGIGLRAIGQQKPIVAYQKEAYEAYQEMLASVQTQIVRSLFLIPQQARAPQGHAPQFWGPRGGAARQPVLRTNVGSEQAKPMPTRASPGTQKLGRNDPCWCGSGKKYKDCHLQADQRANITRFVSQTEPEPPTQRRRR
ncbi:MAG TPA: SEC-C metal-binding domain-containing protein [Anaerolineae bacterium]|nr:SEC-C metal-binding domain-containing protein [Anaerolineae bacterium]HQI86203.1 SEC-C metal-binding domain-containing protein [Anaerolineae bacterium]